MVVPDSVSYSRTRTLLALIDAMPTDHEQETHPSAEQIGAQLEHRLAGREREALLRHLETCEECRRELAEASRLLGMGLPGRRRILVPVATLLAASAAFLLLARVAPDGDRTAVVEQAQRQAQPDLVEPIVVVTPADDEVVTGRTAVLTWRADGRDAMYRVTLQDDAGRVLWTGNTRDTIAAIPDSVTLVQGNAYYWSVDALRPDGRSTTSKAHRFRR